MRTVIEEDRDEDKPVEREGRETLLPSITRSVLSAKTGDTSAPAPRLPSDGAAAFPVRETTAEALRPRGARAGDVIGGRYVVDGQLGRGGMGRVLRVRHQALDKAFALKLIKSGIATDPKIRELFYNEARLASALTHDNICSIVDFGQDDKFGLFMVMELLEGQTAHARLLHSGAFAPRVACDVMWQVGDAVRFIHGRKVIHGDIKTDNIFLVRTPAQRRLVKLLDFGLAHSALTRDDGFDGTPQYMAPERIGGAPASPASDVYAMGLVFFELLTGKLPFTGTIDEILQQHRETPVPAPSKLLDEPLDERADAIIARATAKNPADRYRDASAFMYELRTLLRMLGIDVVTRQSAKRRRSLNPDAIRERREHELRVRGESEVFGAIGLPMASVELSGRVRVANHAFVEFLGAQDDDEDAPLDLRQSALSEVYPTVFDDLAQVADTRQSMKRVIRLQEGGDRQVEAVVMLTPSSADADATDGDVYIVLHPLRRVDAERSD